MRKNLRGTGNTRDRQRANRDSRRGRRLPSLERLEERQLLAADLGAEIPLNTAEVHLQAEGEPAPDLVQFAKNLAATNTTFFGAAWCPHCTDQKQLFEDGGDFLPFVEVTNLDDASRSLNQVGIDNNISAFPTWVFPDGSRETGTLSLETISQRSGVSIPQSETPSIAPIADVQLEVGSPLHISLDGYDPDSSSLTYTVTVSDPSVSTEILSGNRSARMSVNGWGDMVFQLDEQRAPRPAGQFIALAQSDFFDQTADSEILFHRIINGFVIQGGDPTGTGAGGSNLGEFDDQFHEDLQHNRSGILSYAKTSDDTNDSQFFITEGQTRHLDFNHSIFGFLVEGEKNREAISNTATGAGDRPSPPVSINSVEIFEDTENAVVMLSADPSGLGSPVDVTVTATDADGNSASETFRVTIVADANNAHPFLEDIPQIRTTVNTPVTVEVTARDVDGDAIRFHSVPDATSNVSLSLPNAPITPQSPATAQMTVTPTQGFIGTQQATVFVYDPNINGADGFFLDADLTLNDVNGQSSITDKQLINITVAPEAPSSVDLLAAGDTGASNSDNVTRQPNVVFNVSGVRDGAIIRLRSGDTVISEITASGTTVEVPADLLQSGSNDGIRAITATQTVNGVESNRSTVLNVTYDRTIPPFTSATTDTATVGTPFTYDVQNPEEGSAGFGYSLVNPPAGVTLTDPATGQISWTPSASQSGSQSIEVLATDAAGNVLTHTVTVNVAADILMSIFVTTTVNGSPVSTVSVGDEFDVNILVRDDSDSPAEDRGVFSAYADILFTNSLVTFVGPISYDSGFSLGQRGDGSAAGLVDDAGAFAGLGFSGGAVVQQPLLSFRVRADVPGTETIQTTDQAAQGIDNEQSELLLGSSERQVLPEEVDFGSATVTIESTFRAFNDTFNIDEDSDFTSLNVLVNDTPTPGVTPDFSIAGVSSAANGTVEISPDGKALNYRPNPNFFGVDTLTYTLQDLNQPSAGTSQATVSVEVFPVNDPPNAVDDTFTANEGDVDLTLDVLGNDTITPDINETLRVASVTTPQRGTVRIGGAGASTHLIYTPPTNFSGTDTFEYTVADAASNGLTDTATVTVTVIAANDPPVARDDSFSLDEDTAQAGYAVLANDDTGDDTDETLFIESLNTTGLTGTAIIDGTQILYTPAANFFGTDTLTYTIGDGNGGFASATASFVVAAVNDNPTALNDTFPVPSDVQALELDVLANDSSDPDGGETLTITAVTSPDQNGTIQISTDSTRLTYTPQTGFTGTETFAYTISDGNGGTATATVTLNVDNFIPSSLAGFVYNDGNNDGQRTGADAPIANVTVTLTGTDTFSRPVNLVRQTAADGSFLFENLAPGTYTLTETQPAGLVDGPDQVGSLGGDNTTNDQIASIALAENANGTDYNFSEFTPGSVSGVVFEDKNNNGVQDADEPGIPNSTLTLTRQVAGSPVAVTLASSASGTFFFGDLAPAEYRLSQTTPAGFVDGKDSLGSQGGLIAGNDVFEFLLTAGSAAENNNFGERTTTTVSISFGSGQQGDATGGGGSGGGTGNGTSGGTAMDGRHMVQPMGVTIFLRSAADPTADPFPVTVLPDGTFSADVPPGQYEVVVETPLFLEPMSNGQPMMVDTNSAASASVSLPSFQRPTQYTSLFDFTSTGANVLGRSLLFAIDPTAAGQQWLWYEATPGWEGFQSPTFSLNGNPTAAGTTLTVTMQRQSNGETLQADLPTNDPRVRIFGTSGNAFLIYLVGEFADFDADFDIVDSTNQSATASQDPSPQVSNTPAADSNSTGDSTGDLNGEAEPPAPPVQTPVSQTINVAPAISQPVTSSSPLSASLVHEPLVNEPAVSVDDNPDSPSGTSQFIAAPFVGSTIESPPAASESSTFVPDLSRSTPADPGPIDQALASATSFLDSEDASAGTDEEDFASAVDRILSDDLLEA